MSATLTYVYCLVRAARPVSLRRAPAPVPGGSPVRLVEITRPKAQGRRPKARVPKPEAREWLVVSSVPARDYDEAALARGVPEFEWVSTRALAHETVVEHFLPRAGSASAVLPMQLFTLFTSDDRAAQHIAGDRRRIARILARVAGHVEWGLRITLSRPVQGSDPRTTRRRGLTPEPALSGAQYLARKRDDRDAGRTHLARARRDAERAYRAIRRNARAARRRPEVERAAPGSPLVLDAAFLVPAGRGRAFRASVRRQTRALERAGMTVSLTGPWPAFNFI